MSEDRPSNWRLVGLAIPRGVPSLEPLRGRDGQGCMDVPALIRPGALGACEKPVWLGLNHDDAMELRGEGALPIFWAERDDGLWIYSDLLPDDATGRLFWRLLSSTRSGVVGLSPALAVPPGGWHQTRAYGSVIAEVFRAELVAVSLVLRPHAPRFPGTHVGLVSADMGRTVSHSEG